MRNAVSKTNDALVARANALAFSLCRICDTPADQTTCKIFQPASAPK